MTKAQKRILLELSQAENGTIRYTGIMAPAIKRLKEAGYVTVYFDLLPAGRPSRMREIWQTTITEQGRKKLIDTTL